jgi:N-acetylmuramoyl-L-alanine amidase
MKRNISPWIYGGIGGLFVAAILGFALLSADAIRFSNKSSTRDSMEDAESAVKPLEGPWLVAIQPGHWKISELPDEQAHRRGSTGAVYGSVREADINRAVVDALVPKLEGEGWVVVLVPATVPPGLRADAFVSIHADGGNGSSRRGWKLAPSWRPSQAARKLAAALHSSFAAEPELVEDKDGVTIFMRGYFGFNYRRYRHAVSPYTPSVLVELGFVSNLHDRKLMTSRPEYFASLIFRGLKSYFKERKRDSVTDLLPLILPRYLTVGPEGAVVRRRPRSDAPKITELAPLSLVRPVDESGDWYEIFIRRHRTSGWLEKSKTVTTQWRDWPIFGGRGVTIFNTVPRR